MRQGTDGRTDGRPISYPRKGGFFSSSLARSVGKREGEEEEEEETRERAAAADNHALGGGGVA